MAGLSNDIYVVHTLSSGDVAVGIQELVTYKDMVTLVGYNSYNYHQYISQSLVNLTDQILLLKGGPAAQTTAAIQDAVDEAKQTIKDEVSKINTAIVGVIEDKASKAVSEISDQNISIITTQNTQTANIATNASNIQINSNNIYNIKDTIYGTLNNSTNVRSNDGLVQSSANHTNSINSLISSLGYLSSKSGNTVTPGSGILGDIETLKTTVLDIPTLNSKHTSLSGTVGIAYNTSTSSISDDLKSTVNILFKDVIPTTYTGRGIYNDVYDTNNGVLKRLDTLDAITLSVQQLTDSAATSGSSLISLTAENVAIKNDLKDLNDIVGETSADGLRAKVATLESYNISSGLSTLNSSLSTLNAVVGNSSSGLVKATNTNTTNITTLTSKANSVDTTLVNHGTDINDLKSGVTSLNDFKDNINTTINSALTKNGTVYNASKLDTMNTTLSTLISTDVSTQFNTYFKKNNVYINEVNIGKPAIDAWVSDEISGMKPKVINYIGDYLSSDVNYNKIPALETNISTLSRKIDIINGDNSTAGSINKKVTDSINLLKSNEITNINNILTAQNNTITTINNATTDATTKVAALESFRTTVTNRFDEYEKENVKYSIIIPFIKKIALMIRDNTVTNTQIENTFNLILRDLSMISNTYSNNGSSIITLSTDSIAMLFTPTRAYYYSIPEINVIYLVRIRLSILDTTTNTLEEYVAFDIDNTTNHDVVNTTTSLTSKLFYKLLLSNTIGENDSIDTVNDIKTWADVKNILNNVPVGKEISMFLDVGYSPISGDDYLSSYESFKITVNN